MDLVTVTCKRDLSSFLLQAESIQTFVKNDCRHIVYINEPADTVDKTFWQNALAPYYDKHELLLLFPNSHKHIPKTSGYIKQQFYKLDAARYTKEKYLVLDSKNFFIKPTDTAMWKDQIGSGLINSIADIWVEVCNTCRQKLGITEPITRTLAIQTPFVIDPFILGDVDTALQAFYVPEQIYYSEFIFYSLLGHKKKAFNLNTMSSIKNIKHKTIFEDWSTDELDDYLNFMSSKIGEVHMVGFHRLYIRKCSPEQLKKINDWIASFGLTNKIELVSEEVHIEF